MGSTPAYVNVSDANFKEVITQGSGPIMLDFWADWCGPCDRFAEEILTVANDFEGRVRLGILDIDRSPRTARRFKVRAVPTVIFFENGRVIDQITGMTPQNEVRARLESVLARSEGEQFPS